MYEQNRPTCVLLAAAMLAVLGFAPAFGQETAPVTIEVSRCVDLEAPADRLACFEREVEAAQRRAPPAAPAPPPAAAQPRVVAEPPAVEETRAGRRAARAADRERGDELATSEITAKVVELQETVPNALLISLDNGQVWRQMRPEFYPLRPGQEVRVYGTRWGTAFRLTAADLKGFIQVERVR